MQLNKYLTRERIERDFWLASLKILILSSQDATAVGSDATNIKVSPWTNVVHDLDTDYYGN